MAHYFKITKNTDTYKRLNDIINKWQEFDKLTVKFCEDYNISKTCHSSYYLCGVNSVKFKTVPTDVRDNWKKAVDDGYGWYTIKVRPKNRALKEAWDNLQNKKIPMHEIDRVLGNNNPTTRWRIETFNDFYIAIIDELEYYKIPSDCIEITNIEYNNL